MKYTNLHYQAKLQHIPTKYSGGEYVNNIQDEAWKQYYEYSADFYFDLEINTSDNYNYSLNIDNIKHNITIYSRDKRTSCTCDFDIISNEEDSYIIIEIGGKTLSYNFYDYVDVKEFQIAYLGNSTQKVNDCGKIIKPLYDNFTTSSPIDNLRMIITNHWDKKTNSVHYVAPNVVTRETQFYEDTFRLNRNPTISDYDHYLGEKNKAFTIDYTVWDEDNDRLSVTQRLNYDTIGTYSNVASGTSSTIYITDDMLKKIPLNQKQYIYITVDDGKGGQATRTLSFTRTNSAPSISGYDMDLGDKNVGFSISYSVSDADNDYFNITETLNGQTLRNIPNVKGNCSETITISNDQLYNTPLNQRSTLIITVNDGKGGVSNRTYTFTRTNTPVAIGIIRKTYPTIVFRCTDSNPSGYVTRADIYINNNYITAFTSGFESELQYNIDFSYLNEGNNTLMIRATNNQNITSDKMLNIHKKSLKEPEIGTSIIVKGKKYQIINKKNDGVNMSLTLNKPLQDDVSTTDRIEILNDYCKVFAKTDENGEYEEMQFVKSNDLGNGYTQERYQLDITGRKVTTRLNMYGNTSIKQIKEAFQYLED